MKRVILASIAAYVLMPMFVFAQSGSTEMRGIIEADLRGRGVDKTMSAGDFQKLLDALAGNAQKEGITPTTVSQNHTAEVQKNAPPLADPSLFNQAVASADVDRQAAAQQEIAIVVAALIAAALLFGIWRRHKHIASSTIVSEHTVVTTQ